MSSHHENFRSSLIKFCQTALADAITAEVIKSGQFVDFDAHTQTSELPADNLLGIANLHWTEAQFYSVGCSIGFSSWQDTNLFMHNALIGFVSKRLKTSSQVELVDSDTGAVIGWMVVEEGSSLFPMLKTDTRSLQFLMVSFQSSQTSGSA